MNRAPRWYRDLPWRAAWIAIGWILVGTVVVLSQVSLPPTGPDIPQGDKLGHALAYFALAAWFSQITASRGVLLAHAAGFVMIGMALEVLQAPNPERHFEVLDMLANAAGVALGLAVGAGRRGEVLSRLLARSGRSR